MTDKITKLVLDAGGSIIESDTGTWDGMEMFKGNVVFESIDDVEKMLNAAPTPPNTVDKAAYDGAREDLAIWKKRALEAENKVKIYDQRIVDIGAIAMSPVKVKQPPNTITITADEYERLKKDAERLEHVDDLLYQIESWCKAYPLDDFTTRPY